MNYEDEPYVRLYIRRTVTNRRLGWEGRAVMHEMMYEFDRAGVFDLDGDPYDAVELVTGLPQDVVRVGLDRLLRLGTWVVTGQGQLFWPKFLEGQTATRSDRLRQQESRRRRRDLARRDSVTACDASEQPVTTRDDTSRTADSESRTVTSGHERSQPVTPSINRDREEIPPTPQARDAGDRDPFGASLRQPPGERADVRALLERFKAAVDRPGLKFTRGGHDAQAQVLADAIDAHGLEECLLVAAESPNDPMVSGKADEKGMEHKSIRYVFDNPTTFARILAAAKAKTQKKKSVAQKTREAMYR